MKILLHICCGVCAAGVAERLIEEGNTVVGYFYNPNIYDEEEYNKRLEAARKVSKELKFELIEGEYDHDAWSETVSDKSHEPEGGERCSICFSGRLKGVKEFFLKGGYDAWTTTLTVSPHKDNDMINLIGSFMGSDKFIVADFKKKGGFQRAIQLAKEMDLYRQKYCGCEWSVRDEG